jgi:hypothetical protein
MRALRYSIAGLVAAVGLTVQTALAGQGQLYMAGDSLHQIVLDMTLATGGIITINYVSPASPVVHGLHLTLIETHREAEVHYFSVLRNGRKCASLDLRPSQNADIILADVNDRTFAFSRISESAVKVQRQALQHVADSQRGFPNKGLIKGYTFLSQC